VKCHGLSRAQVKNAKRSQRNILVRPRTRALRENQSPLPWISRKWNPDKGVLSFVPSGGNFYAYLGGNTLTLEVWGVTPARQYKFYRKKD
jgi:hypothetical protein